MAHCGGTDNLPVLVLLRVYSGRDEFVNLLAADDSPALGKQ